MTNQYSVERYKSKKRTNLIIIILLAVIFAFGSFILTAGVINTVDSIKIEDVSTLSYKSITQGEKYYFDEMVLLEEIGFDSDGRTYYDEAYVQDETSYNAHYVVRFVDKEGDYVYTSIKVENNSDFNQKCKDIIKDENVEVDDKTISGCFFVWYGVEFRNDLKYAYEEYNEETPGELLEMVFRYEGAETIDEYKKSQIKKEIMFFIIPAIIMIPSLIGFVIQLRKRKKLNRKLTEEVSDEYIENLKKYAENFIPGSINEVRTQREMLRMLGNVISVTEIMLSSEVQRILQTGSSDKGSVLQLQTCIAAGVNNCLQFFNDNAVMEKIEKSDTESLLRAWIVLAVYCDMVNTEHKTMLHRYYVEILFEVHMRGFRFSQYPARNQYVAVQ